MGAVGIQSDRPEMVRGEGGGLAVAVVTRPADQVNDPGEFRDGQRRDDPVVVGMEFTHGREPKPSARETEEGLPTWFGEVKPHPSTTPHRRPSPVTSLVRVPKLPDGVPAKYRSEERAENFVGS